MVGCFKGLHHGVLLEPAIYRFRYRYQTKVLLSQLWPIPFASNRTSTTGECLAQLSGGYALACDRQPMLRFLSHFIQSALIVLSWSILPLVTSQTGMFIHVSECLSLLL